MVFELQNKSTFGRSLVNLTKKTEKIPQKWNFPYNKGVFLRGQNLQEGHQPV